MNILIINKRNKIRELKKERDEMFSILDEVNCQMQKRLLSNIIDLTDEIDHHKKMIKELLNNETSNVN